MEWASLIVIENSAYGRAIIEHHRLAESTGEEDGFAGPTMTVIVVVGSSPARPCDSSAF